MPTLSTFLVVYSPGALAIIAVPGPDPIYLVARGGRGRAHQPSGT